MTTDLTYEIKTLFGFLVPPKFKEGLGIPKMGYRYGNGASTSVTAFMDISIRSMADGKSPLSRAFQDDRK